MLPRWKLQNNDYEDEKWTPGERKKSLKIKYNVAAFDTFSNYNFCFMYNSMTPKIQLQMPSCVQNR